MCEAAHDPEFYTRRRRGTGAGQRRRIDPAHIGRAELESLRGIDPDRIEKLAADEFDASDERRGRLDVALDQRDAVDRFFEFAAGKMLIQRRRREEQSNAQTLSGAIMLEDCRITEAPCRFRDILLADDRKRFR